MLIEGTPLPWSLNLSGECLEVVNGGSSFGPEITGDLAGGAEGFCGDGRGGFDDHLQIEVQQSSSHWMYEVVHSVETRSNCAWEKDMKSKDDN